MDKKLLLSIGLLFIVLITQYGKSFFCVNFFSWPFSHKNVKKKLFNRPIEVDVREEKN